MKEFQTILRSLETTTSAVLATLVKIEGSSYRRVGARLLWNPSGTRIGSISGGCLEEDLLMRAQRVFDRGQVETVVYDTTSENDLVWGVGLGCHGIVHVLLEKVNGLSVPLKAVRDAWARREPAVLMTRFDTQGASIHGTVALANKDGAVSYSAEFAANDELIRSAFTHRKSHWDREPKSGDGTVLYEFLPPPLALAIWGAGDDAQPLARLAKELGWRVTVGDPRAAFATRARFPEVDEVRIETEPSPENLPVDPWSVAVVMSHHYRFDVPALRILLPLNLRYLGILGPKKRAEKILDELSAEGMVLTSEARARLHAPVGLDIGANTPEQVALSIVAEIEAVMNARDGRSLKERKKPIHG